MTTMTEPISDQLDEARRNATALRTEFDRAEGELAQAVEALDYDGAARLKQRADELRPSVILAENHVRALEQTAQALADHDAQLHAAEREKARQDACDVILVEAMAAEQAAIAEADLLLAQAREALWTIASTLRAAQVAEGAAGDHRRTVHQAQVDAGRLEWARFPIGMPNRVEVAIDESPIFPTILRISL